MFNIKLFREFKDNNYINNIKEEIFATLVDLTDDGIDVDVNYFYKENESRICIELSAPNGFGNLIMLDEINSSLLNLVNYIKNEFPNVLTKDNPIHIGFANNTSMSGWDMSIYYSEKELPTAGGVKRMSIEFFVG